MPSALQEAKDLIKEIKKADGRPQGTERLLYVNKLKQKKTTNRTTAWVLRNPDFGLSPLVAPAQNSPVVPQGTYRMLEAAPIVSRHIKRFTETELSNIVSPDPAYRINAKQHLAEELVDSERRIYDTMEFTLHSAIARGAIRYILNDSISRIDVNLTFPVKTKTVTTSWATTSTDIVTDMDDLLREFRNRAGKNPDLIRMTTATWEYLKKNTVIKATYSSYLRTTGMKPENIAPGLITKEFLAKALDWPVIEVYDERTQVKYAATNTESAASNVVIELTGGTFGLSVGDKVLIDYKVSTSGFEDWDSEATITAVNPGVSITINTLAATLNAGEFVAAKPTFFPEQKILLIADETENEVILPPFGIEYTGSEISMANWYGPRMDVFNNGPEPGMGVSRRVWLEWGLAFMGVNKAMSVQIIP